MRDFNQLDSQVYDLIGVGVGPFNLGLAALVHNIDNMTTCFFEKKRMFSWHTGIMPEWSTLQLPFIADLVSFADPTSQFSYLNYLKKTGGLYQFYIRESFYPLRSEYNDYCKWVSNQLNNIYYGMNVIDIKYDPQSHIYIVSSEDIEGEITQTYAKHLILGTGRTPIVPDFIENYTDIIDLGANYLENKSKYQSKKSITIVGSGQSSAEIFYDLLQDIDSYGYEINWITMADRIFSMDLGKLSLELTSPDYTNYFHSLEAKVRDNVINGQDNLYKGINLELINKIYDLLYIKSKKYDMKVNIMSNVRFYDFIHNEAEFTLYLEHLELNKKFTFNTEALILALGYEYKTPGFLKSIQNKINWNSNQSKFQINKNYSINDDSNIFVQNVGLYAHGLSVPDLGMGCYRNSIIINQILGKEHYHVENKIAFQSFAPQQLIEQA